MRLGKTISIEELQIISRFEGLRKILALPVLGAEPEKYGLQAGSDLA